MLFHKPRNRRPHTAGRGGGEGGGGGKGRGVGESFATNEDYPLSNRREKKIKKKSYFLPCVGGRHTSPNVISITDSGYPLPTSQSSTAITLAL